MNRRESIRMGASALFGATVGGLVQTTYFATRTYTKPGDIAIPSDGGHTITPTLHTSNLTRFNFPMVDRIPVWAKGTVNDLYVISPEDIATTTESREALGKYRDYCFEKISFSEFRDYIDRNNIQSKMADALRDYLNKLYPDIYRALEDNIYEECAENILYSNSSTFSFSRRMSSAVNDTAVIITPHAGISPQARAKMISGLSLDAHKDAPGTQIDIDTSTLAHETGHILRSTLGKLHTDVAADAIGGRIYNQELAIGNVTTPGVPEYKKACRGSGAIMIPNNSDHATSLALTRDKNPPPDESPNAYINAHDSLMKKVRAEVGYTVISPTDYIWIYKSIIDGAEPYQGKGKVILKAASAPKPSEETILKEVIRKISAADKDWFETYKTLSKETREKIDDLQEEAYRRLGADVIPTNPKIVYTTVSKLYQEGMFDGNILEKHYAYDFLIAAQTYFSKEFNADNKTVFTPPEPIQNTKTQAAPTP